MDGERENRRQEVSITETPKEFRLEPWPTPEEYILQKNEFQKENIESVLLYMKEDLDGEFSDLSEAEFNKVAELISIFQFGAYMAFKRIGDKDTQINVGIDINNHEGYGYAAYDSTNGIFLIKKCLLVEDAKDAVNDEGLTFDWGGMECLTPTQLYEIGGLEEAVHSIFHKQKGNLGKNMYHNPNGISKEEYFSSEIEYRALLWKFAYVRRYMPEHYESIKNFILEIEDYMHGENSKQSL